MDNKLLANSKDYDKSKLTIQKQKKKQLFSGLAFLSSIFLFAPSEVMAASITLGIDCMGVDVGDIDVNTSDFNMDGISDIKATFTHTLANFGAAANQCWGGHFNWLNVVRSGSVPDRSGVDDEDINPNKPGVMPPDRDPVDYPWIDPVKGGNFGMGAGGEFDLPDDSLPFYWGEKPPTATEVADNTMGNMFMFFDQPSLPLLRDAMWNFETYLVSVPGNIGQMADMSFHLLGGFKWKFTQGETNNKNTITNLMEIPLNMIDAADINIVLDNNMFADWEATKINARKYPEPSSLLGILALGTLGAGSALNRKLKQHKSEEKNRH